MTNERKTERGVDGPLRCVVCLKKIQESEERTRVYHGGADFVVCCASCAAKFEAHPEQYVSSL